MTNASCLPRSLCAEMEDLFEADFAEVRVNRSARRALPGVACTRGTDVFLASDAPDLGSPEGRAVLGHELAHVLQQRLGRIRGDSGDWLLEAEAAAAGARAARGAAVPIAGARSVPRGPAQRVIQHYTVVAPAGRAAIGLVIPNPQRHAPVQARDTFVTQTKGAASPTSFLLAVPAGAVNLVAANPATAALRVSANQNMAIQDVDVLTRQPKAFYATQAIIDESNARLALLASDHRLFPDPAGPDWQTIQIGPKTLLRVTLQNMIDGSTGFGANATQSCNQLVEKVLGHADLEPLLAQDMNQAPHLMYEYHIARELVAPVPPPLDDSSPTNRAASATAIAVAYAAAARGAAAPFDADLQRYGLNQYAAPEVGEAFVTCTLLASAAGAQMVQGSMPPTQFDHYRLAAGGGPQVLMSARTWGAHWAGVVAKDGADVVTLENYARNTEDALAGTDRRYYFQLYDTAPPPGGAGSWHHAWTTTPMQPIAGAIPAVPAPHSAPTHEPTSPGARSFANPITIRVGVPADYYNDIAAARYGAVHVDTIKNDHNLIAGAADAQQEMLEVLKGLRYANVRLAAGQAGALARIAAWTTALSQAHTLARFRGNLPAIQHAYSRLVALHRISI
jgi:hypothetical protein